MQVTLTPQNPQDQPMNFELEEGGSLVLGGVESGADLSWDLLDKSFKTRFSRQGDLLFLERESDQDLMVAQESVEAKTAITSGQILTLGNLIFTLTMEPQDSQLPEKELTQAASQDESETKKPLDDQPEDKQPEDEQADTDANDEDIFGKAITSETQNPSVVRVSSSRWLFKVLTGPNSGAQMNLDEGKPYVVGSDGNSCDIVLTDLSVSKQHLKLTVFASGEMLIEDLKSRNGVLINGEKIDGSSKQTSSALITCGATTFMVVDRTVEQKTIVTTTLPVKEHASERPIEKSASSPLTPSTPVQVPSKGSKGKKIALLAMAAVFLLFGWGLVSLFSEAAVVKEIRPGQAQEIAAVLEEYPYFEYNFNEATGVLTLNGHILTVKDKRQLLAKLSHIDVIRRIDDTNLVVDEIVWQQFNMALEKTYPAINLSATSPGEFVLTGTLETAEQAQGLNHYIQVNFPYNDNLQNKVVVLEQLLSSINERLSILAPGELLAELNQGELILVGTVPSMRAQDFRNLVEQVKNTPGIRSVRNLVVEQTNADDSGMIDITSNYNVSGFSKSSDANTSVIINGRILQRGDQIDGMTVISIRPRVVILDRDGIKYKINYNS